jgi:splicing factor 3A subunit 3
MGRGHSRRRNEREWGHRDMVLCMYEPYFTFDRCPTAHRCPRSTGQKNYSKQTVYDAHLTSKKHLKATSKQATTAPPPPNPNGTPHTDSLSAPTPHSTAKLRARASAHRTYLVTALLASLVPTLNDSKSNVERRFSLTAREREQELLEQSKKASHTPANKDVAGGAGEEEEEEERIYNPLKLPLGWDGKPIPYWLYKLHGLGVEYRCEICSDHVYMGRCASTF